MSFVPLLLEKVRKQRSAFLFANATYHIKAVIESLISVYRIERSKRASFLVARAENASCDARLMHESGTHYARLKRYIDRAIGKPPRVERFRSRQHSDEFRVRSRILLGFSEIVGLRYHLGISNRLSRRFVDRFIDHNSADRNFSDLLGKLGLLDRHSHVVIIGFSHARMIANETYPKHNG